MAVFKFRNLNTSQAMPVPEGEYVVGRSHDAYVYVDDPSVSRSHARLTNSAEGFFIEDLGSSNGTAMRGAFLTGRAKLEFGSTLYVGSVPFRIDPEVVGEVEANPAPSTRGVNLASMRRATERIPSPGEGGWSPPAIAPDKLSAPEVNPGDSDAEELNAVTIREPASALPPPPVQATRSVVQPPPPVEVGVPLPIPAPLVPIAQNPPATPSKRSTQTLSQQPPASASQSKRSSQPIAIPGGRPPYTPIAVAPATVAAVAANSPAPPAAVAVPKVAPSVDPALTQEKPEMSQGWIWPLVIFLAGLGVGIVLGLVFARIFFELGVRAADLPRLH